MSEIAELPVFITSKKTLPSFAIAPELYEPPKKQEAPDDEYSLANFKPLVLRESCLPKTMRNDEVAIWNEKLRYLSTTKGLEFDTDRTRIIEDKLKEAAEKTGDGDVGQSIRVVIMNKGLTLDAFVAPDNTVFVTQHLIHKLGFFDSAMGVAAHEMGHAADGVYENIGELDPIKMFSARWLSEPSADLRTPKYLDSIGLNSTGLEIALAKLETEHPEQSGRSPIYQELTQRRAAILAKHKLQHHRHGTKPLTPLPSELDIEARPTNLELLKTYFERGEYDSARDTLPKLCKKDLEQVYARRWSVLEARDQERKYTQQNKHVSQELNSLLTSRLSGTGFDEMEIKYLLLDLQHSSIPIDHRIITNPEQLIVLSRKFKEFELGQLRVRASKELFESAYTRNESNFLTILKDQMRDINANRFPQNDGIPVTKDILLGVLKDVSDVIKSGELGQLGSIYESQIAEVLFTYATVWLDSREETIQAFFERAKSMGVTPSIERWKIDSLSSQGELKSFGDHTIEVYKGKLGGAREAFVEVFIGKEEIKQREVDEKPIVNEEYIKGVFPKIEGLEDSREKAELFSRLLYDLRNYFDEENLADSDRLHLLGKVFKEIDLLPLNQPEFYRRAGAKFFDKNIPDLLRIGETWKFYDNPKIKEEKDMNLVKNLAAFNLKFVTALSIFKEDGPEFYNTVQILIQTSGLDISGMTTAEVMRLCRPLFSLDLKGVPQKISIYGFGVNSQETVSSYNVERNWWGDTKTPRVTVIKNISMLESLPFVKNVIERGTDVQVRSLDELVDLSDKIRKETSDFFETHYPGHFESYYDDTTSLIILGEPVRRGLTQLLAPGELNYGEFDKLHNFLESVLPDSVDKDEILRGIREEYLRSSIPLSQKINFFKEHSEELGTKGLVTLASQIRGEEGKPGSLWSSWEYFKNELDDLVGQYIRGEKSMAKVAVIDSVTSYLSDKFELALSSCDASPENTTKLSTELADIWVDKTMVNPERSYGMGVQATLGEYNFATEKFQLTKNGRVFFRSFDDVVRTLHNMEISDRAGIVMKSLVGDRGVLSNEEGRKKLAEFINASLQMEDPFMNELVETLCEQATPGTDTRTVFAILGSHLLGNLLFGGIRTESVDTGKILEQRSGLKSNINEDGLMAVLSSGTRDITAFGTQYQHQPNSRFAQRAQESDNQYNTVINFLKDRFVHKEAFRELQSNSDVPKNVEALFRGAETTILGTRSIQTTRQMRRFENESIDRRMAKSFDANPGMDPLRFFLALDSYARLDPNLEKYLKNNLIDIEGFLAGGSMASAYVARALSTRHSNKEVEVVIRELTPGADLEIVKIGETFLRALDAMVSKPRRSDESKGDYAEKQKNIRLAQIVLRFTTDWCLADIRDPNYETNDDRFKDEVVAPFNRVSKKDVIKVPEREFTSEGNWVRVETRANGKTLREYLDDLGVSQAAKSDVVWLMSKFNHFQYGQSVEEGKEVLVQSDPSIGNYIIEGLPTGPVIHVLDRGLMIPLDKRKIEMVRSLLDGNNSQFLQQLVGEVIDYNIAHNDKYKQFDIQAKRKLEGLLKTRIVFKVLSNKVFGRTKKLLDNVTTVNDVFIQEGLMLPYVLEVPIKNIAGIGMLIHDYTSTAES